MHHPTTVKKVKTMKTYKYELGNWIPKVYLESLVIRLEDEIFFHILYMSVFTFEVKRLGEHGTPAPPLASALFR